MITYYVNCFSSRFHGLGIDGQKGVKDLLRMDSDDEGCSDSELLDIENPSTPDGPDENSSFHSGAGVDSPGAGVKDFKHINNNTDTPSGGAAGNDPANAEDRKPVLDFSFLNTPGSGAGGGLLGVSALHNSKDSENGIRNWLKNTATDPAATATAGLPPIPGFPPTAVHPALAGLPHPHPLHPFLLPFSAFAAAAAAAAATGSSPTSSASSPSPVVPPPVTSSAAAAAAVAAGIHHPAATHPGLAGIPGFPPGAAAGAGHHLTSHHPSPFHVKDSV